MTDWDWVDPKGYRRTPAQQRCHERLLAWDIRAGEAIVVAGGFNGIVSDLLLGRYPEARMFLFEPQREQAAALAERYGGDDRVRVLPYGLGERTAYDVPMTRSGSDAASFMVGAYAQMSPSPADYTAEIREFWAAMLREGLRELALLHLNVEQYEYVLLPHIIGSGWAGRIAQYAVQAHGFPGIESYPGAEPFEAWAGALDRSHRRLWDEMGGWFGWARSDRVVPDIDGYMRAEGYFAAPEVIV